MSVLMEFAIFPTDKGKSVSAEVSKIIEYVRSTGVNYKLGAMGTTIETDTLSEALLILEKSFQAIEEESERVYASVKFDIRKGEDKRLTKKVESIESKIGSVNR